MSDFDETTKALGRMSTFLQNLGERVEALGGSEGRVMPALRSDQILDGLAEEIVRGLLRQTPIRIQKEYRWDQIAQSIVWAPHVDSSKYPVPTEVSFSPERLPQQVYFVGPGTGAMSLGEMLPLLEKLGWAYATTLEQLFAGADSLAVGKSLYVKFKQSWVGLKRRDDVVGSKQYFFFFGDGEQSVFGFARDFILAWPRSPNSFQFCSLASG